MYSLDSFHVLLFQVLVREATRTDLFVQVCGFVYVTGEHRDTLEVQAEAFREEVLDAHDVAGEVVLGVRVPRGGHLREIYDCDLFIVVY